MKVNTVVSGAGEKPIVPKMLFKYVLYSHLFIYILCSNVGVRNETTNSVEGTTQKRIVPTITKDNVVYYAYPQVKAESIAKRDSETTKESSVFQTATNIKRSGSKITYPAELNDLDAVFTAQINSTPEKARSTQATNNLTSAEILLGDKKPVDDFEESTNVDKKHLKDLLRITALRSKYGNKIDVHKDRKTKHDMDFFGSFIEPLEINSSEDRSTSQEIENDKIKQILQWSNNDSYPFINIASAGQKAFIDRNCSFTNCMIIKKNSSNVDVQEFDAVLFFGKDMMSDNKLRKHIRKLSKKRLQHQRYIFVDSEYHQLPRLQQLNNFFNWTFTYKLNSDLIISPFVIKNAAGKVVAPSRNVTWIKNEKMGHVSIDVMNHLIQKSIPLIWFYSCETVRSVGNCYIRRLVRSLKMQYYLHVDRINSCWYKESSSDTKALISKIIKRDYYFYMGFEDIERGDYVSDKILPALNNYAVPIVFGGANYSRFLPDNSYLDATKYTPKALAEQIYNLVRDFNLYVDYFKWTTHYSVHKPEESPETDYVCKMCEMLNDETKLKETSVYGKFNEWWENQEKESPKVEDFFTVTPRRDESYVRKVPKKSYLTGKEFLRQTARAYTYWVDSLVGNVKTVFNSIFG